MRNEIRFDVLVDLKEAINVNNQVFQYRKRRKWLNRNMVSEISQKELTSQRVVPIDLHGVGATDTVGTGSAV